MQAISETAFWREQDKKTRWGCKYEIVSKVAYLIGVPYSVFENEHEAPLLEIYKELDKNKNARIVRHLCIIRSAIERWFGKINAKMYFEYRTLHSVPEFIPQESLEQLSVDGIRLTRQPGKRLIDHILELNRIISDRINNCKDLFPEWVKWDYIRDLFIMKNGLDEGGAKAAGEVYYKNKDWYPYKMYINWVPEDQGNILYHDKKFVTLLYQFHRDKFTDIAKVSNEGNVVVGNINDFVAKAKKAVMVVDCENAEPYHLCAMMKVLDTDTKSKISKIMLFGDDLMLEMWRILESYTTIPIEQVNCQRVVPKKSLVDIEMTAFTCREHYRENVDSFIIVASDSDYWGLISSLPEARFLVMIEREKSSKDLKIRLEQSRIFYGYIEDFYDGNAEKIKATALLGELEQILNDALKLNVKEALAKAIQVTGIQLSPEENREFIKQHLSDMKLVVSEHGKFSVRLNIEKSAT